MHPEPASVTGPGREGPAQRGDALAHAEEPVPSAVGRCRDRARPLPLSSTVISAVPPTRTTLTSAFAPAPACLRTLVSASWTIR